MKCAMSIPYYSQPPPLPSASPSLTPSRKLRFAILCCSRDKFSSSCCFLYLAKSQSSKSSPSSSSSNHSGLYWNCACGVSDKAVGGAYDVATYQISSAHANVLASGVLRLLSLSQSLILGFFLVHSCLLPFSKCLWRNGCQIRTQFMPLRLNVDSSQFRHTRIERK
jgi:hypothetical protein